MKTIVILSPDQWGAMKLSKMHFAETLAEEGHHVFFINPPRRKNAGKPLSQIRKNLTIVSLKENPLRIFSREKCRRLYRIIEKKYIARIRNLTGAIDELWCFNAFFISDLKMFEAKKALLFVYDLYTPRNLQKAAAQADGIVSIAQDILDEFRYIDKPKLLINHGLAPAFEEMAETQPEVYVKKGKIRIGYVGNLVRQGIDRNAFENIIDRHPETEFHFWGPVNVEENNLLTDAPSEEIIRFVAFLKTAENVILHGVKSVEDLAPEMAEMDGFIYLYDVRQDVNAGFNSHKLMEYIATGKIVFSSYVSGFGGKGLLVMDEKESDGFEKFFKEHLPLIEEYNSAELQKKRKTFALDNTYKIQVGRIREWMG